MDRSSAPTQIAISAQDIERMCRDVEARRPEEACGLLAGRFERGAARVEAVLPMQNALHSPARYRLDAAEQIRAFAWIEAQGLELTGIYHSHPEGPAVPSATDIAEAYYPQAVYWIWSGQNGAWQYAAFTIHQGEIAPVTILTGSGE
ncbi:MAG: M67 family metallopeptidase [Anaerolineales bacterium]|nr:M67 family metallopeptidase [Anaerolineales bacterium]